MVEASAGVVGRRSRAEIARLTGLFGESGLGRREFCERHGMSLSTLNRHLKKQSQEQTGSGWSGENRLVAVEVADPSVGDGAGKAGGTLTVLLRNGRRVEAGRGFDATTLAQLVEVLERI